MGKIHPSKDLEVIGIEARKQHLPHERASNSGRMSSKSHYLSDPWIITRIQKYIESNQFVDIGVMAEELQRKYPKDYGKRKRSAFRSLVKKAYGMVMQSYDACSHETSSEDLSDESGGDDNNAHFGNNSLNNEIMHMYHRNMPKPIGDNELIDISSDDSIDVGGDSQPSMQQQQQRNNEPSSSSLLVRPHFMVGMLPQPKGAATVSTTTQSGANMPPAGNDLPSLIPALNDSSSNNKGKKRKAESSSHYAPKPMLSKKKRVAVVQESKVTFRDVGGMDRVLMDVCQLLVHVKHPEVYRQIGITPPRGFLLHGPPGCGKTLLANAIAGELEVPLIKVSAPELVAGVSGESEERIRELFERAVITSPCILFIDEIDAITPNRQFAQKDMERRIVAQLLTCLDDLNKNENGDQIVVIGATNRPDSLDPALRRAGRFDREICLGIPDCRARLDILKVLTGHMKLEDNFDFESLAKYTPGYVGADLVSLTREAAMSAVNRVFNEMKEKSKLQQAINDQQQQQQPSSTPQQSNNDAHPPNNIADQPNEVPTKSNSSDAEIIVDADEPATTQPNTTTTNNKIDTPAASDGAVVVIEDDGKKADDAQSNVVNSTDSPSALPIEQRKIRTPLEELVDWLHEVSPLTSEQLSSLYVTSEDFAKALKCVQPSAKREGFATVPDVTWNDVGSLRDIREELQMAILAPVRHEQQFNALGLTTPTGVLLCGPPGCGKTLLAKAIANEAGINFISVKGPELLNMYVGESERAVRLCFERARNSAPCVIFFDELDALCPKRSDSREGGATMRVVNQMLTEMDGMQSRRNVYILAASNRPDIIDPAVLRPGRLDKIVYVGLPSPTDRIDILRTITKNGQVPLLAPDVDLETIGKSDECEGYTGADLAALVREAGVQALREVMVQGDITKPIFVRTDHFTKAVAKIRPSVTEKDQQHYNKLKKIYSAKQPEIEEMEYS